MKDRSFYYEFSGEEIQKDLFAHGKYDIWYTYEDNQIQSISVSKCFQRYDNYIEVDLGLPANINGVYQACEQDLIEARVVI